MVEIKKKRRIMVIMSGKKSSEWNSALGELINIFYLKIFYLKMFICMHARYAWKLVFEYF